MFNKPQLKMSLQNACPIPLKTMKIIKNKENLRNCHQPEEPQEKWQLNVLWHPGRDLKLEKEMLDKTLRKPEETVKFSQ